MARIIGGFAVSHTPTIAFAHDANKYDDPVWAPIFEGFRPVKEWLAKEKPDVVFGEQGAKQAGDRVVAGAAA